jgi:hypothetical protein
MNGFALAAALLAALPAAAQAPPGLCGDRPGLDTPPCTVERGHLQLETAAADWTDEKSPSERSDAVLVGDTQLRYGVADAVEARLGWTPYGWVREHDRETGATERRSGVGDVTIGIKANPIDPAAALQVAVLPYATLPAGRRPIGAGDWGAGLLVPLSYLFERVTLELTPEVDAAVDEDGTGRHLAFGGAGGVGVALPACIAVSAEVAALRDRDPVGHVTTAIAGLSAAWQPRPDWQLDVGTNLGLDRNSPDVEVYAGIAKHF